MAQAQNTTETAFADLVNRPDLWRKTGRSMDQRQQFLHKLKNKIGITLDTKEKILTEAGYAVVQEKIWKEP